MASILRYPLPTKESGQRSVNIEDLFLTRFTPPWARPSSVTAYTWRAWVLNQPVAVVCRETLIATLLSLDWKITPRNSKYREELEPVIRHYTKLISKGGEYAGLGLDYSGLTEWISGDVLDTPFGGAAELGRAGNTEGGRVVWIRPLDAGTLYPTLNDVAPVVQYWQGYNVVAFPKWAISRTYMSPISNLWREGWGMPPPEKIYFAISLLNSGDKYYANLLLDVPTAGILDLGDMAKDAAEEWITAFKSFVNDQAVSFRVPVLYEHNNPINFLPFGKVPNDIMYDKITMKYAALTAAAYGMSLSDIGMGTTSASGETLAGSIRQERRTRKTGFARIKAKMKAFWDNILPDTIEFNYVDYDDELNVALGRARLASSQAFSSFRDMGLFSPQELRSQAIQDGLVSISLPDELPPDAEPDPEADPNAEPELLQGGKAPSAGGEGEVKSQTFDTVSFRPKKAALDKAIRLVVNEIVPKIVAAMSTVNEDDIAVAKSVISESFFSEEDAFEVNSLLSRVLSNSLGKIKLSGAMSNLSTELEIWGAEDTDIENDIVMFESNVLEGLNAFLGKAILFTLNEVVFDGNVFADSENVPYNEIVKEVQDRIYKSLPEYVRAHVALEFEKIIQKIKED